MCGYDFDIWPLSVAAAEAAAAEENGYLDPQQEPRDSTTNTAEYNDDLQYKRDNSTATTKTQVYLPATPTCITNNVNMYLYYGYETIHRKGWLASSI